MHSFAGTCTKERIDNCNKFYTISLDVEFVANIDRWAKASELWIVKYLIIWCVCIAKRTAQMKGAVGAALRLLAHTPFFNVNIHQLTKRLTIFSLNESQLMCVQCSLVTSCWSSQCRSCANIFHMSRLHKCSIKLKLLLATASNLSSVWFYHETQRIHKNRDSHQTAR